METDTRISRRGAVLFRRIKLFFSLPLVMWGSKKLSARTPFSFVTKLAGPVWTFWQTLISPRGFLRKCLSTGSFLFLREGKAAETAVS